MNTFEWPIAPICDRQLRDINKEDLIGPDKNGYYLYRRCNTYKGGGGYDRFESIWRSRHDNNVWCGDQFVVQLNGCPLQCPYCYVTPDGTHSRHVVKQYTENILHAFYHTKLPVFHLMGGAPAMYMSHWTDILSQLSESSIFHSDLLLIEHSYDEKTLSRLGHIYNKNALYAVSVKGKDAEQFKKNTGCTLNENRFWINLMSIVRHELPFYITFTGMSDSDIDEWRSQLHQYFGICDIEWMMRDSYAIQIRDYEALK